MMINQPFNDNELSPAIKRLQRGFVRGVVVMAALEVVIFAPLIVFYAMGTITADQFTLYLMVLMTPFMIGLTYFVMNFQKKRQALLQQEGSKADVEFSRPTLIR